MDPLRFDEARMTAGGREERLIITGNPILAVQMVSQANYPVAYTKEEGNPDFGVMLPRGTDPTEFLKDLVPRTVNPDIILKGLAASPGARIRSPDKHLYLVWWKNPDEGTGTIEIGVRDKPAKTRDLFVKNPALLELLEKSDGRKEGFRHEHWHRHPRWRWDSPPAVSPEQIPEIRDIVEQIALKAGGLVFEDKDLYKRAYKEVTGKDYQDRWDPRLESIEEANEFAFQAGATVLNMLREKRGPLSPEEVEATREWLVKHGKKYAPKLFGDENAIRLVIADRTSEQITSLVGDGAGDVLGFFMPALRTMAVLTGFPVHEMRRTFYHELIHAMKAERHFRESDWRQIVRALRPGEIPERVYGSTGMAHGHDMTEEGAAELFADWMTNSVLRANRPIAPFQRLAMGFIGRQALQNNSAARLLRRVGQGVLDAHEAVRSATGQAAVGVRKIVNAAGQQVRQESAPQPDPRVAEAVRRAAQSAREFTWAENRNADNGRTITGDARLVVFPDGRRRANGGAVDAGAMFGLKTAKLPEPDEDGVLRFAGQAVQQLPPAIRYQVAPAVFADGETVWFFPDRVDPAVAEAAEKGKLTAKQEEAVRAAAVGDLKFDHVASRPDGTVWVHRAAKDAREAVERGIANGEVTADEIATAPTVEQAMEALMGREWREKKKGKAGPDVSDETDDPGGADPAAPDNSLRYVLGQWFHNPAFLWRKDREARKMPAEFRRAINTADAVRAKLRTWLDRNLAPQLRRLSEKDQALAAELIFGTYDARGFWPDAQRALLDATAKGAERPQAVAKTVMLAYRFTRDVAAPEIRRHERWMQAVADKRLAEIIREVARTPDQVITLQDVRRSDPQAGRGHAPRSGSRTTSGRPRCRSSPGTGRSPRSSGSWRRRPSRSSPATRSRCAHSAAPSTPRWPGCPPTWTPPSSARATSRTASTASSSSCGP